MVSQFKKLIIFLILGVVILGSARFISRVFSYDTNVAHPFLTEAITNLYNKNFDPKLSNEQVNWLKRGSIEEDTPLRWMNHFYEPNSGNGLPGYLSSKDWSQSPFFQSIEFGGDQTWQKAINSYVKGDNQGAFFALGHILHLLEDGTVPAHTRLDTHIFGDPYENWVKNNIGSNINFETKPVIINSIDDAFDNLAKFSNKNFLSKDTIEPKDFINKNLVERIEGNISYECFEEIIDGKKICLVIYKKSKLGKEEYLLDFSDTISVHSDYYSLLAPKAISYGAGVIELFFKEAEKRKAELEAQKKAEEQKSWWQKLIDGVKSINIFSSISGPIVSKNPASPEPAESIYPSASSAATPLIQTLAPLPRVVLPENKVIARQGETGSGQIIEQVLPQDQQIPSEITENKLPQDAVLPSPSTSPSPAPSASPGPSPVATTTSPSFGGSGGLPQEEEEATEQTSTSTPPAAPEISISLVGYSLFARSFFVTWQSSSSDVLFNVQQKQDLGDWQEWISATTSTSALFVVPQDLTDYYFRAQASDTNNATSTWAEIFAPINFYPVVINEIAWAGTEASSQDEWVEFFNRTPFDIDMSGWRLVSSDNKPNIVFSTPTRFSTFIYTDSFYLIERTNSSTTSEKEDWAGSFGSGSGMGLGNNPNCEILSLYDSYENLIDRTFCLVNGNWPAGAASPNYQSMERVNPHLSADIPGNWQSNSTTTRNGLDSKGQPINGTPKAQNSVFDLNFFYLYPAQNTTATSTLLNWTQSSLPNLKEYRIARSFDLASSTPEIIAKVTDNTFFDGTLESETEYYYKILACDSSDNCVASNSISTTTPEFPFVWAEPQIISGNLTSSAAEFSPDIVLANNGLPVVIWYSATSTDARYIKVSQKDQNNNWSEQVVVSAGFMPHGYPPQILRGADFFEVLYTGEPPALTWRPPIFDIFDVRASASAWSEPRQISDSGYVNLSPSGVIDNLGITHIVWQGRSTTTHENFIFYLSIDASGAPLGEAIKIASSSDGFMPNIVLDSQNRLHVFWYYCPSGSLCSIYYSYNNQDGAGWKEGRGIFDTGLSSSSALSGKPEVLINTDGSFFIAWDQKVYEISAIRFDGATTTNEKIFKQEYKILNAPNLVFNNKGKPYLLWAGWNDSGVGFGLYFTSLNSKNEWRSIKKVFESMEVIRLPRVAVASDNTMHLVWYGGEGGDKIYYMFSSIE